MFSHRGIAFDAAVKVTGDCAISAQVIGDQAEIRFGGGTLSLVLDESTRERIGDRAAAGLWTAFGYFQQLPSTENQAFLARYRDSFGPWAPPVSTLSESTYSAVRLYSAAARQARQDDPAQVITELQRIRAVLPRGRVELAGPHSIRQQLRVAEASAGGYLLLEPAR